MSSTRPWNFEETSDVQIPVRDYSLTGINAKVSLEKGLADADWYRTPIPKEEMKKLLERRNGPAIRDCAIWVMLLAGSGVLGGLYWGTAWCVIPFFVYGILYASSSDSRWHESSHGTPFKTDWMNHVLYEVASFMVFRESIRWKWSHARHHSDTLVIGRDTEIIFPRPTRIKDFFLNFTGIPGMIGGVKCIVMHATGRLYEDEKTFIPESEHGPMILRARIYVMIYLAVIGLAIGLKSWLPLMYIGLPTLYGSWLMLIYGTTQHAGLVENKLDHRLNCRTIYMNFVHRYLYWNMGYHIEHHMFPLVPYYNLPRLHELMKDDCPKPYKNLWEAWKEVIASVFYQADNPDIYVERVLPETAHPSDYRAPAEAAKCVGEPDSEGWVKLNLEPPEAEDSIRFDHEGQTYAIYRTKCGSLHATDGICTHGASHLADGMVIGKEIECAKHNGRFDVRDGSCQRSPVCVPVKTHPIKEVEGELYFRLNAAGGEGVTIDKPQTFRVVSNQNVATYIKELTLEPLDGELDYQPGDYLQFNIPRYSSIETHGFDIEESYQESWRQNDLLDDRIENTEACRRNYSMASAPGIDKQLKFNVRFATAPKGQSVSHGVGSSYVFNLKPGDRVTSIGPFGDFRIQATDREMIYIGGGAGMAPLKSHITHLFENEKTNRKVTFFYGARSLKEVFYLEEFMELEKKYENFSFHLVLSEPKEDDQWTGLKGFVHESVESIALSSHVDPKQVEYYLCGPPMMVDATQAMLKAYDIADEDMHCDAF
jgi:MocE subfamily Rieske [2Fe-2S] domain protein